MGDNKNGTACHDGEINLLQEQFGSKVLRCSDDFFGSAANLIKREDPRPGKPHSQCGRRSDAWETRRRRNPGHDWCILQLGLAGLVRALDVDTRFCEGNLPEAVSVEACTSTSPPDDQTQWFELVPQTSITNVGQHTLSINNAQGWTHLRLNIFPDGAVARLRAYGEPQPDWSRLLPNELVDLAAAEHGARTLLCSDEYFSPACNIIAPGRGRHMGDGWETRRRRSPGFDWCVIKLASPGVVQRVLLDTRHFHGNYPQAFALEGAYTERDDLASEELLWSPLIERSALRGHNEHVYQSSLTNRNVVFSHVRLNIYPDGGLSRLRVLGYPKLLKKERHR